MNLFRLSAGSRENTNLYIDIITNASIQKTSYNSGYSRTVSLHDYKHKQSEDPLIKEVRKCINNGLRHGTGLFIIKFMNKWPLIIVKGEGFYINGYKKNKGEIDNIVSYMIKRHLRNIDYDTAEKQFNNMIDTSIEITQCIINKLEYKLFIDSESVKTLLNVEKTSKITTAIEINSGVWLNMKDKDFCQFIKACKGRKNKFFAISPEELYYYCTGKLLSSANIKVINAFLIQNRHTTLIAKKSMELFNGLCERFPNRIKEISVINSRDISTTLTALLVKGKIFDWVIVGPENALEITSGGMQNVSTYIVVNYDNFETYLDEDEDEQVRCIEDCTLPSSWGRKNNENVNYITVGSICIDQAQSDISIGDQFAARALAVMNDEYTLNIVSTLRSYSEYKPACRMDFDAVSELFIN